MEIQTKALTLGDVPIAAPQQQHSVSFTETGASTSQSGSNHENNVNPDNCPHPLVDGAALEASKLGPGGQNSSLRVTRSKSKQCTSTETPPIISDPTNQVDQEHKKEIPLSSDVVNMTAVIDDRDDVEDYIKCPACDFTLPLPKKRNGSLLVIATVMVDVVGHFKTTHPVEYRALQSSSTLPESRGLSMQMRAAKRRQQEQAPRTSRTKKH